MIASMLYERGGGIMYKIECLTQDVTRKVFSGMCNPDYGLDCSPEGECPPEEGSEDCDPYST